MNPLAAMVRRPLRKTALMIEQFIDITTADSTSGNPMVTFVAHPDSGGPHPLVLFFMDAPGMREEIRDMARRLATAGYYVMAFAGLVSLVWKIKMADTAMRAVAPVGAALTFIALVTGSIWGKPTWGAWWVWDARITSMLILLFLYLGVVALFEAYENQEVAAKACAVLSLVGMVNIPIIYKSVDWWYSLHQPASIKFTGETAIDASMLYPLLLNIGAFYALFALVVMMNMRAALLERHGKAAWLREVLG